MNSTKSNGSQQPAGPRVKPSTALSNATLAPRSSTARTLATHSEVQLPAYDQAIGRHERWAQAHDIRWSHVRKAQRQAEANAAARRQLLGHITSIIFLLVALGMAASALHREQRLAPQERQALGALR